MNDGISWDSPSNVYWKHDVEISESLKIILHANAEFEAKDALEGVFIMEKCEVYLPPLFPYCLLFFALPG